MSYQALLFCPDEKTARVVTQVLTELEFNVEACSEPFAAVKKLMATQFDAIVVDCDNEQNSALLFKSARNSAFNQSSLAVAVVEGQAGVAKAFRIGANLVLTKPINVEQSKGTLRVARGLLRKAEASKTSVAVQPATKPADHAATPNLNPANAFSGPVAPAKSVTAPSVAEVQSKVPSKFPSKFPSTAPSISAIPAPMASSSAFEVEDEAMPSLAPTEAAFLESIPDRPDSKSVTSKPGVREIETLGKQSPWQPLTQSTATPGVGSKTSRHSSEVTGQTQAGPAPNSNSLPVATPAPNQKRHPFNTGLSSVAGAAAAPALAKETPQPKAREMEAETVVPASRELTNREASQDAPVFAAAAHETKSKMPLIAALAVIAVAGAGYLGWSRMHPTTASAIAQNQLIAIQTQPSPITPPPAEPGETTTETSGQSQPVQSQSSGSPEQSQPPTKLNQNSATGSQPARTSSGEKGAAKIAATKDSDSASDVEVRVITPAQKVSETVVKSTPAEVEQIVAPPALQVASNANDQAIAGLVSTQSLPEPKRASEILKISQGITEGMLLKKVAPHYPSQAVQMRKQGTVVLQANIGKTGSIANAKVIKGDALLAQAALAAVSQWKYKPYLLDGQPIAVQTQISVTFKLP